MFCKFCGEKIDDNSIFCMSCGSKLVETEKNKNPKKVEIIEKTLEVKEEPLNDYSVNVYQEKVAQPVSFAKKQSKTLKGLCLAGIITGIVGFALFLFLIILGLVESGKIHFFDMYGTKIGTIISLIFMIIGLGFSLTRFILSFTSKNPNLFAGVVKRILIMALAVACLGCSIFSCVYKSPNSTTNSTTNSNTSNNNTNTGINFYSVYSACDCAYPWADCGADFLSIDSNPYDYDDELSSSTTYLKVSVDALKKIHTHFSLPSYLIDEMLETRAIDGRQTYTGTLVNVSWRYHPDSGLEVRYTKK